MLHTKLSQLDPTSGLLRAASVGFLVSCSAMLPVGAGAQQGQAATLSQAPATPPTFVIRGFDITGDNPLADGDISRILAPYLRTDATIETLQKATAALETALKEKGYSLYRVALPPQEVGRSVTLNIVKFVIGKVSIEGRERYSEANIRASLPELKEGTAPNFRKLAVQTAIANESQGKQLQVALKESEEVDKIDVRIVVKESKPWSFAISESNTGSSATGNDRLTLSGTHSNLFDLDHQLTAAYTTSLERLSDVRQFGLNYRVPLYRLGGVAGVSYTRSDVVGNFGTFNSTGAGQTFGLNYNHYLPPDGGHRSYVSLGIDHKQFDVTQINGSPLAGQLVRRSQPLTLGYTAKVESDSRVWGYNLDFAANLPGGSGNDLASYQSEDPRVSTVGWKVLRGGANYLAGFSGGWLLGVRGQLQLSADALISGEQFGLGGATSVRGVGERPLSGDSGMLLSTEITTHELAPGLRLLGFVDAGWLSNKNPNGNPKPAKDSLSSAGVGLRYTLPSITMSADFGRVLSGSTLPYVAGSGVPQTGDQKLHVNLSARF
ncbi:MAG: ShlB/FhaC/HecB family hemolysin secretion/activation protein [Pseudomonadota bacterium]